MSAAQAAREDERVLARSTWWLEVDLIFQIVSLSLAVCLGISKSLEPGAALLKVEQREY